MKNKDEEFMRLLSQLRAIDIVTLARLIAAPVKDEQGNKLDGGQIIDNVLAAYRKENRANKRDIVKILRATVKHYKGGDDNGTTTNPAQKG